MISPVSPCSVMVIVPHRVSPAAREEFNRSADAVTPIIMGATMPRSRTRREQAVVSCAWTRARGRDPGCTPGADAVRSAWDTGPFRQRTTFELGQQRT